jgi:hypothetical protein
MRVTDQDMQLNHASMNCSKNQQYCKNGKPMTHEELKEVYRRNTQHKSGQVGETSTSSNSDSKYEGPNIGWHSPTFELGRTEVAGTIVSGTYQFGFTSNTGNSATIYNDGWKVGPLGVQQYDFEYSTELENVGLGIELNEPSFHSSGSSSVDIGSITFEQTADVKFTVRKELYGPLAVVTAGYYGIPLAASLIPAAGSRIFEEVMP